MKKKVLLIFLALILMLLMGIISYKKATNIVAEKTISGEIKILEKESDFKGHVDPKYGFTEEEVILLSQLLCGQAGKDGDGEYDFEFMIGRKEFENEVSKVLLVVMNRVMANGAYADNVEDVVTHPGAFVVFPKNAKTKPAKEVVDVVRNWCYEYDYNWNNMQLIPENHFWFSSNGSGSNITRGTWRVQ